MALKVIAGGGAAALTMGVGYGLVERRASTFDDAPDLGAQAWLARLGTSLPDEKDSRPGIEGEIPAGLRGTLYRNGPGLFDRDGDRKRHLLDGDGMIRCWDFSDQDVRFRTSFVKTRKYKAEEAAGRFLYPTWTSLTGKWGNSLGGNFPSQAGVTPVIYDGKLLAFDEIGLPWELDPHTLETIGEYPVADDHQIRTFKAHTKTDAKTGDLILLGSNSGRKTTLHVVIRGKDGALKSHFEHESPRASYFHDFFATENYVIAHLQPFELPTIPVAFLAGVRSFTDSLTYDRSRGTILIVMPKDGSAPRIVEAPGCFMWHTLNAYERGDEIIADFVGFDDPGHAFGERAIFKTLMRGKAGESGAPGTLRRYVLDPAASTAREEVIADGQFEFPIVNWTLSGYRHRYGYVAAGQPGDFFHTGVARIDTGTGARTGYDFGSGHYVGEPVFAPKPGAQNDPNASSEAAWLLCEVHHKATQTTRLAILDAENLSAGPVAQLLLDHHLPISFHGWWHEA